MDMEKIVIDNSALIFGFLGTILTIILVGLAIWRIINKTTKEQTLSLQNEFNPQITSLNSNLETYTTNIRSHVDTRINDLRSHLDTRFIEVRSHVDTRIDDLRSHVDTRIEDIKFMSFQIEKPASDSTSTRYTKTTPVKPTAASGEDEKSWTN